MYSQRKLTAPPGNGGNQHALLANPDNLLQTIEPGTEFPQSPSHVSHDSLAQLSESAALSGRSVVSTADLQTPASRPPQGPFGLFRRRTWEFLNNADTAPSYIQRAAATYQISMALSILVVIVADTENKETFGEAFIQLIHFLEVVLLVVFTAEYILRIYSSVEAPNVEDTPAVTQCRTRLCMALSPIMILDLICIGSMFYNQVMVSNAARGFVSLRLLRLLNIFRVERNFQVFRPVLMVVWNKRRELGSTMGIAAIMLVVASAIMYYIETDPNDPDNKYPTLSLIHI